MKNLGKVLCVTLLFFTVTFNLKGRMMPKFDGTGPGGRGPLTGRGMGPCAKNVGRGPGRGFGRRMMPKFDGTGPEGRGPLTGRKMGPCANDENNLVSYKEELEKELEFIKKELANIKK